MQIPQAAREISEQHSCQAALHGCLPAETAPALPEQCSSHLQGAAFSERSENGEFNFAAAAPPEANPLRYTHFALRFSRSRNPFCFQNIFESLWHKETNPWHA